MPPPQQGESWTPCAHHPQAQAGWQCGACATALCPDCVTRTQATWKVSYDACLRCEGHLDVLLGPAPSQPMREMLRWMFRVHLGFGAFLTGLGLLAWAVLSCRADAVGFASHGQGLVWSALLAVPLTVLLFAVMHGTAQGPDLLEADAGTSLVAHGLAPALPFIPVVALVLALPPSLVGPNHPVESWIWKPGALALVALGGLLWPAAALLRVTGAGAGALRRIPGSDWALCLGLTVALGLGVHWLDWSALTLVRYGVGFHAVVLRTGMLLFCLVAARVHGLFLHAVAPRLGYPLSDRYRAPVLPDAVPRGTRAPKADASKRDRAPIEL